MSFEVHFSLSPSREKVNWRIGARSVFFGSSSTRDKAVALRLWGFRAIVVVFDSKNTTPFWGRFLGRIRKVLDWRTSQGNPPISKSGTFYVSISDTVRDGHFSRSWPSQGSIKFHFLVKSEIFSRRGLVSSAEGDFMIWNLPPQVTSFWSLFSFWFKKGKGFSAKIGSKWTQFWSKWVFLNRSFWVSGIKMA